MSSNIPICIIDADSKNDCRSLDTNRQIRRAGPNSAYITLPQDIISMFGWKFGDDIRLFIEPNKNRMILEKVQ